MKTKLRMRLEIKEISAEGTFEGLLSPYGNVDQGNDVVVPGAYAKTLKDQGNTRPLLWQHRPSEPIGDITLEDREDGLWCKGQLLMALPEAAKAYLLIKARIVKGLSIGFESVKDSIENGVRQLKEIKLFEGSIVTFPMNESALITSVKGLREQKGDFNEELTEIQLGDAGYQMRNALSCALYSITWADLTKDEKVAAAEATIQQFSDAFMAYFPAFLDMLAEQYGAMETWSKKIQETKSGRAISAANKQTLKSACDHMKNAQDLISALCEDEAEGDDTTAKAAGRASTSESKAANPKTEPAKDHSALSSILTEMRGNFNGTDRTTAN